MGSLAPDPLACAYPAQGPWTQSGSPQGDCVTPPGRPGPGLPRGNGSASERGLGTPVDCHTASPGPAPNVQPNQSGASHGPTEEPKPTPGLPGVLLCPPPPRGLTGFSGLSLPR